MKKAIVLAIVGLAAGMTSSYGQSTILLDNYNTSGPSVLYGAGSDGSVGAGLSSAYTMGLYYALGNITGSIASDPTGTAIPSTLGALILGSGTGSTSGFANGNSGFTAGRTLATDTFSVPGTSGNGGEVCTLMILAYEGASYASASYRGHSAAFVLTTTANTATSPAAIGTAMQGFSAFAVAAVPEPATMALGGLGLASLLLFRRKQA